MKKKIALVDATPCQIDLKSTQISQTKQLIIISILQHIIQNIISPLKYY